VHSCQGAVGDLACAVVAVVDDAVDVGAIVGKGGAASAKRVEQVVHRLGQQLFESPCAGVPDLVSEPVRVVAGDGREEVEKTGDGGPGDRVVRDVSLAVGACASDHRGCLIVGRAQGDAITSGLAHLRSVQPRQHRGVGEERIRFGEERVPRRVALVEAAGDESRGLHVWELVEADGDQVRLAEQNVRRLVDGIGEHEAGRWEAGGLGFGLDGGVSV
jgi:hypothetical protein